MLIHFIGELDYIDILSIQELNNRLRNPILFSLLLESQSYLQLQDSLDRFIVLNFKFPMNGRSGILGLHR